MNQATIPDYEDHNRQTLLEKLLFPAPGASTEDLVKAVSGKTILITGASYGIGAAVAEALSSYKVTLILVARTRQKLEELQQRCLDKPCSIHIFCADLREESQIIELLHNLTTRQIEVDIFINNAGKSIHRGLDNSIDRYTDTRRCSATNYTGPVQLLLGILPGLVARKGQIVNVSAQNVLLPPTAGWSAYQSSKVAFDQWLRCMEPELRVKKVAVSSVYLPVVRTRMSMVNEINHKRPAMSKAKAVTIILNRLVNKKRKYRPWWTGIIVFSAVLFPNLWYRLQVRHLKKKA
ncbi:MAG: SDR family NAD(P)-dependent oxidoreductase [Chitinophagaceae bacterium]|nr:SDR family NAD(P)-dependent oxidoreductase [Chitinophagaceae bacterium]